MCKCLFLLFDTKMHIFLPSEIKYTKSGHIRASSTNQTVKRQFQWQRFEGQKDTPLHIEHPTPLATSRICQSRGASCNGKLSPCRTKRERARESETYQALSSVQARRTHQFP